MIIAIEEGMPILSCLNTKRIYVPRLFFRHLNGLIVETAYFFTAAYAYWKTLLDLLSNQALLDFGVLLSRIFLYYSPQKGSKIGQNNRQNRRSLASQEIYYTIYLWTIALALFGK